jgi:hypothetical protein
MSNPTRDLQELLTLRAPPDVAALREIAERAAVWATAYKEWRDDLMRSVAEAELSRHEALLERIGRMEEHEMITQLTSSDEDWEPQVENDDGTVWDATPLYNAVQKIHAAACTIDNATGAYLNVIQDSIDFMLGDDQNTGGTEPRALRELANLLSSAILPFSSEVSRLREGTSLLMGRLGQPPETSDNEIADHVVIMARAGHSDAAIARVLGESYPEWLSSALFRVRVEAGGGSAPRLETKRVQELLTERVRKMRTERCVPAGRDVRSGKVDPLGGLRRYVRGEPEADE